MPHSHQYLSFRKTGYLKNLCSLIITLQRRGFHLSYQKNLPVAGHKGFFLVNSINAAIYLLPHPPSSCSLTSNL